MAEKKQRSAIFKFFYIILTIITFPVFLLMFILRHPIWLLFIILICVGAVIYWPMSQNVALEDITSWYQKKYTQAKHDLVIKAVETGKVDLLPKSIVREVKKMEEDAREDQMPKSENYNKKVVRDVKSEEMKAQIKKRGGFKKKEADDVKKGEVEVLSESGTQIGGLSQLIKQEDEKVESDTEENNVKNDKQEVQRANDNSLPNPDAQVDDASDKTENDAELDLF